MHMYCTKTIDISDMTLEDSILRIVQLEAILRLPRYACNDMTVITPL